MSDLNRGFVADRQSAGHNFITASETISPTDQVNHVDLTDGAVAITLPPVALCAGKFYSFYHEVAASTAMTFVTNNNDAYNTTAVEALSLEDVGDYVIFFCDGFSWIPIYTVEGD